jgi:hypothetical protein
MQSCRDPLQIHRPREVTSGRIRTDTRGAASYSPNVSSGCGRLSNRCTGYNKGWQHCSLIQSLSDAASVPLEEYRNLPYLLKLLSCLSTFGNGAPRRILRNSTGTVTSHRSYLGRYKGTSKNSDLRGFVRLLVMTTGFAHGHDGAIRILMRTGGLRRLPRREIDWKRSPAWCRSRASVRSSRLRY